MNWLKQKYTSTNSRSKIILKNIGFGFLSKALSILLSFVQIPLVLGILDAEYYGVWLTIFSISSWFVFFDFGFGNGLRNKLTAALVEDDTEKARKYVSTTYFSIAPVFIVILVVLSVCTYFIPWVKVLNAPESLGSELKIVVFLSFFGTTLNIIAAFIHNVIAAHQKIGKSQMLLLIHQIISIVIILLIKYFHVPSPFLYISVVLSLAPFICNLIISIYYYRTVYYNIRPSLGYYERSYRKDILSVGLKFFIIQLAILVIFSTDNIIIAQLYSPVEVTSYNIVYKYFIVIVYAFNIISAPMWTLYIDAYKNNNYDWINGNVKKLLKVFGLFSMITVFMILVSSYLFRIWIGPDFKVPLLILVLMGIYNLQAIWNTIFTIPLNSIGKLQWQVYTSVLAVLTNIPLVLFFNLFFHDISSVIIANIVCLVLTSVISVIEYKKTFAVK